MSNWLYPKSVQKVEKACVYFLSEQLNVEELQAVLYQSEQEIKAFEEKWLRSLLFNVENELEEIIYTVSEDEKREKMITVVNKLLFDIKNRRGHIF